MMEETKSQQYVRQSQRAKYDILMGWPDHMRKNANDPAKRFLDEKRTEDQHLRDAIEVILDVARTVRPSGKGPHTPLGHDCVVCDSMRVVVEWLAYSD